MAWSLRLRLGVGEAPTSAMMLQAGQWPQAMGPRAGTARYDLRDAPVWWADRGVASRARISSDQSLMRALVVCCVVYRLACCV
jgi:hypothetical protein